MKFLRGFGNVLYFIGGFGIAAVAYNRFQGADSSWYVYLIPLVPFIIGAILKGIANEFLYEIAPNELKSTNKKEENKHKADLFLGYGHISHYTNGSKDEKVLTKEDCPKGCGELKEWDGKLRCWKCGWPDK